MAQHPHAGGLGTLLWYYQYTDSRVTISPTVEFTYNAHEDIMGSASYYTKQTGAVYEEHIYDAWGGVRWSTGYGVNDGKTLVIEPNYTGHSYDPILKIYHGEARFYDAKTRQWMASDPIKSGLNWYQYVASNPTTYVDPDGLAMKPIVPPPPPPSGTSPEDTLRWMVQKAQWEASKAVYNTLDYLFNDEEHAIGGIVRGASDGAADTVSGIVSMPLTAWNILADKSTYQNVKQYLDMSVNERFDLLMKVPAGVTKSTQNEYYRLVSWWENDIINGTAYTRTKAGTPFVIDAALGWAIGSAFSQSKITHGALKGLDAVDGYFPKPTCPLASAGRVLITNNIGIEIDITPLTSHSNVVKNPGYMGVPGTSIDIISDAGEIITRRWYDASGRAVRDIDFGNHGNPVRHPEWPHEHIWRYDPNGKPIGR